MKTLSSLWWAIDENWIKEDLEVKEGKKKLQFSTHSALDERF